MVQRIQVSAAVRSPIDGGRDWWCTWHPRSGPLPSRHQAQWVLGNSPAARPRMTEGGDGARAVSRPVKLGNEVHQTGGAWTCPCRERARDRPAAIRRVAVQRRASIKEARSLSHSVRDPPRSSDRPPLHDCVHADRAAGIDPASMARRRCRPTDRRGHRGSSPLLSSHALEAAQVRNLRQPVRAPNSRARLRCRPLSSNTAAEITERQRGFRDASSKEMWCSGVKIATATFSTAGGIRIVRDHRKGGCPCLHSPACDAAPCRTLRA